MNRLSRPIGVFVAALIVLAGAAVYTILRVQDVAVTTGQLRAAQLGVCRRVQILRDQVNSANQSTYNAFVFAADLTGATNPAGAARFRKYASGITYIPRTNCQKAVDHPLTYKPPAARPFGNGSRHARLPRTARPAPGSLSASAQRFASQQAAILTRTVQAAASVPGPSGGTSPERGSTNGGSSRPKPKPTPPRPTPAPPTPPTPPLLPPSLPPLPSLPSLDKVVPCMPAIKPVVDCDSH